jgi:GNAT superfamily N-acetyltransferase
VTVLWHGDEPIGICVFACPARSLRCRNDYFGLRGGWSKLRMQRLNQQLMTLSRVVLHPTYRGAGLSAAFVRASCQAQSVPWIEALAEMGHLNPFFERAGFERVGVSTPTTRSRAQHSALYGANCDKTGRRRLLAKETYEKSRHAAPVYYIYDNRRRAPAVGTSINPDDPTGDRGDPG